MRRTRRTEVTSISQKLEERKKNRRGKIETDDEWKRGGCPLFFPFPPQPRFPIFLLRPQSLSDMGQAERETARSAISPDKRCWRCRRCRRSRRSRRSRHLGIGISYAHSEVVTCVWSAVTVAELLRFDTFSYSFVRVQMNYTCSKRRLF